MLRLVRELTARGVTVQFIKETLTFTGVESPMNVLMLTMLGAFAQFERSMIREWQREGIAKAKAKGGVYKGRKPAFDEAQAQSLQTRVADGISETLVAKEFQISRETLYKYLSD